MPEPRRPRRPHVTLCAAITFDGKLDAADPLPPALLNALVLTDGDRLLADTATAAALPPEHARNVHRPPRTGWDGVPRAVRALLADPGVRRVLCLGGARTFPALLDAGLADDLLLLVRPRVDGHSAAPTLSGPPTPEFFPRSISCRLRRMEVVGSECLLHYTVVGPRAR